MAEETKGREPWANYSPGPKVLKPRPAEPWANYVPPAKAEPDIGAAVAPVPVESGGEDEPPRELLPHGPCARCGRSFKIRVAFLNHSKRCGKEASADGLGNVPQGDPQPAA